MIRPVIEKGKRDIEDWHGALSLDEAVARFDEPEETRGIEPLSEAHARLILVCMAFIGFVFAGILFLINLIMFLSNGQSN